MTRFRLLHCRNPGSDVDLASGELVRPGRGLSGDRPTDEGALDDLVKFSTVARFEPHRTIINKGDPGDCLYGILSGRVRIYSSSAEGGEVTLNVLEAGDLFGEIALLDGSTRTASA